LTTTSWKANILTKHSSTAQFKQIGKPTGDKDPITTDEMEMLLNETIAGILVPKQMLQTTQNKMI